MNVKKLIQRVCIPVDRNGVTREEVPEEPLVLPPDLPQAGDHHAVGGGLKHVALLEDWLPVEAEEAIIKNLRSRPRDFVELRAKRTARYGGEVGPPFEPEPLPCWLKTLCGAVSTTVDASSEANHVLVNHYEPGQGIMPHTDGPAYEPWAAILSLGSAAIFEFWRDHEHAASGGDAVLSILLPPRSLLFFKEEAYGLLHGISEQRVDTLHPGVANWTPAARARWGQQGPEPSPGPAFWVRQQIDDEHSATEAREGSTHAQLPKSCSLRRGERFSLTLRRVPLAHHDGPEHGAQGPQ